MSTITKKDFVNRIAESTQAKQSLVKVTVQSFLHEIIAELARGNHLEFRDFRVFETKRRAPRTAQNPMTLKRVQVPARRTLVFEPERLMKEKMNSNL